MTGVGSGTNDADTSAVQSRATKIVKLWIPGVKFGKNGVFQYENGGTQGKFFTYQIVVYAYSNYTTLQDTFYVGRVNDYIKQIYFKDG